MTFSHDDELRRQIIANVGAHARTTVELDGRRHAAVAIVVVDSVPGSDPDDPADVGTDPFANVPGIADTTLHLDDLMTGVSGGAAIPTLSPGRPNEQPCPPVGPARWTGRRR